MTSPLGQIGLTEALSWTIETDKLMQFVKMDVF